MPAQTLGVLALRAAADRARIQPADRLLDTLVEPSAGRIKLGGNTRLAGALVDGLYEVLFGIPVR